MDTVSRPKLALALVQEPPVGKNGRVQADGWRVVAKNNCRAAVLVNQGIHYWALDQFTHRDSSAVCVKIYDNKSKRHKSVYMASIYLDRNFDTITDDLKNLVEYCCLKGVPLIVGIDSNAHNMAWGSSENNKRGEELEEFLLENDLFLLNRGDKPTYVSGDSKTHIDLTIANRQAVDIGIDNWEVLDRATASENKYISFKIGEFTPFQREFRNFKKAKWMEYKQTLDQNILELVEITSPSIWT